MNLTYNLILKKPAMKYIKKQTKENQHRIIKSLRGLQEIPPVGDIKSYMEKTEFYVCVLVVTGLCFLLII